MDDVAAPGRDPATLPLAPHAERDEWYSFDASPRTTGAHVLLTLDEGSYTTESFGQTLAMGDHPIAWTRCVGRGRSFYSAIGHLPESYADPHHRRLLQSAIVWAAGKRQDGGCRPAPR